LAQVLKPSPYRVSTSLRSSIQIDLAFDGSNSAVNAIM
jgi:hypothetical protein